MASFDKAIPLILKHEGGYVNNPNDAGQATNFGVSLRFLKDHPESGDFDQDGDVDAEDIRNMTMDQAEGIYKQYWWDKFHYGNIVDQTIATKIFDMSVNMGAKRAHIITQTAMNKVFGLNLTVDGILGPASLQTINACQEDNEQTFLTSICDEQYGFYQRLIAQKPSLKVFANGWKNRAYDLDVANSVV